MNLSTIIPPAAMPLDVADARTHVRQDLTDDDATLLGCIRAARSFAQTECRRTLVATRYLLREASTRTLHQQLDVERDTQSAMGRAHDYIEGVTAFLEKRPAQFKGK